MDAPVYPAACVAADHRLASQAGIEILHDGGNAVDAAVATSFALSVVRPYSCGVGGGGFMVLRLRHHARSGATPAKPLATCINYRETAPAAVHSEYFEKDEDPAAPTRSGKAVAVPGHVAGMLHALDRYGTMPRERVLAPAIHLAKEGYAADAHYAESSHDADVLGWLRERKDSPKRFPFLWNRFLNQGDVKVGDRIELPEQARLLERIAREGAPAFYSGEVARAIVDAVHADGGELTLDDLASFRVKEVAPLQTTFRSRSVLSMPPPSSGGIVLAQVFAMLEARREDLDRIVGQDGHNSPRYVHLVAEACKHAFADRARYLGDTDFVDVSMARLLDPALLAERAGKIDLNHTLAQDAYGTPLPGKDGGGTSHLCVIDAHGNAVACTETINLVFGSFVGVDAFGFMLNDTIDDFVTRTGKANAFGLSHGSANRPAPGKRPLSSMSPTIVLNEAAPGEPVVMIAGGSGGPRIISGTLQAILNVLLFDLPADRAVGLPRFHHQWDPHVLQLEDPLRGTELETALQALGHETGRRQPVGAVQIIRAQPGGWQPASDPRKGGVPAGY